MDTGPFTVEELDAALHKASRNKSAGVDDIPTEAWQSLTEDNRQKLLDILNQARTAGHIPQEWKQALVVEISKGKGSTADPNNYRPISLLSTAYKLMARIVQQRLEKAIDLRDTQFGFRAGHSTSQPVHVLRRLLEKAERTDDSLYVLLLHWRQAFDKVNIEALEVAMQRMGVPQFILFLMSIPHSSSKSKQPAIQVIYWRRHQAFGKDAPFRRTSSSSCIV